MNMRVAEQGERNSGYYYLLPPEREYLAGVVVAAIELVRFFSNELHKLNVVDDGLIRVIKRNALRNGFIKSLLGVNPNPGWITVGLAYGRDYIPKYIDKDGKEQMWEIVDDVSRRTIQKDFHVRSLGMVSFMREYAGYLLMASKIHQIVGVMKGDDLADACIGLRTIARQLQANFGLADAVCMLEYQDEIPEKLRFKHLLFPGTLLRDQNKYLQIPRLMYNGAAGPGWRLDFVCPNCDLYDIDHLVQSSYL